MVALLAAICIGQAPDLTSDTRLNKLVTVAIPAQAVSEVFAGLGTQELTLSVSDPFDGDIVAIKVD